MGVLRGLVLLVSFFIVVHCTAGCPQYCSCTKSLNKVSCSQVSIIDIPSSIPNDTRLLDLIGCGINQLSNESFKNFRSLERIDLSKQKGGALSIEDGVFEGLYNLSKVYLSGNIISSLPPRLLANLANLNTVHLNDNPLTTFPENLFKNSPNIKHISVGNTQLSKDVLNKIGQGKFGGNIITFGFTGTPIQNLQDGFFTGLPLLEHISFENCEIESIGADILNGTKVTNVNLANNLIKEINVNAFRGASITTFKCSNCQLTSEIAFGFIKTMTLLTHLNLENNNLTSIMKEDLTGLTKLSDIKLKNNSIETIEENPFADLVMCISYSKCIDLSLNPLKCDCKLTWLKNWTEKNKIDQEMLKCQSPVNLAGKTISQVKVTEFCCIVDGNTTCSKDDDDDDDGINGVTGIKGGVLAVIITQLALFYSILTFHYF